MSKPSPEQQPDRSLPPELGNIASNDEGLSQYETGTRKLILKTQLYFFALYKQLETENKELKARLDKLEGK